MNPAISIITPTFNSETTVRKCLESIKSQRCDVEHIIIDGGSTDGTPDILATCSNASRIVSEPDGGVYEAMNKGIRLATGDIIGILNSDDFYSGPLVLANVAQIFRNPNIDSCYGDLVYVDRMNTAKTVRYWKAGRFDERRFYWGWMPPHPTFFVRRGIYQKYGLFNLSLGSAADYELMLRFLVKHRITTAYIQQVLVIMRAGGISNITLGNRLKANEMDRFAWKVNGLKPYPWTTFIKPLSKIMQFLFFNGHAATMPTPSQFV